MHVIPALLYKIITKKQYPLELLGNPDATRPFVYVDDAIKATTMIFEKMVKKNKKVVNNDFNIGSSEAIKIKDLAKLMWKLVGDNRPFQYKVINVSANTAKIREGDITKIKNIIGWEPKISLSKGILRTAKWVKNKK